MPRSPRYRLASPVFISPLSVVELALSLPKGPPSLFNHTVTLLGCIVSFTTFTNSAVNLSMSVSLVL